VGEDRDILYEQDGDVVILTVNRPERRNAMGLRALAEIVECYERIKADKSVRAIVFTGAGTEAFCVGMDLRETAERGGVEKGRDISEDVREAMGAGPIRYDLWLPFIVAVNGVCAGRGLHYVGDADIVIASETASFTDTHVSVGQVSILEPATLIPRIGLGNMLQMVVLGRHHRIDAQEALRIHLVNEVVPPEQLLPRAVEVAHLAARNSPAAIEASKRGVWRAVMGEMEHIQYGWDLLRAHWQHPDSIEGPRAFTEKRPPVWTT